MLCCTDTCYCRAPLLAGCAPTQTSPLPTTPPCLALPSPSRPPPPGQQQQQVLVITELPWAMCSRKKVSALAAGSTGQQEQELPEHTCLYAYFLYARAHTHAHMHTHTHAHPHTRTHTHTHTRYIRTIQTHTTHIHMHTRTHTHSHAHAHTRTHDTYTPSYTHAHTHTNTHMHTSTHRHIHTRTLMHKQVPLPPWWLCTFYPNSPSQLPQPRRPSQQPRSRQALLLLYPHYCPTSGRDDHDGSTASCGPCLVPAQCWC